MVVNDEINELIRKGAIREINESDDLFISNIFVVPKKNGKLRPVINLRSLNEFVSYEKFKQENLNQILSILQKGDYFCSVDLKDAYFSVPIAKEFQRYLSFQWNGRIYCFTVLPFGLSSAPRIFTKILKPVYAYLRSTGIRCSYYLDDSLIMNQSQVLCMKNTQLIIDTLHSLGFHVNFEKTVTTPTQIIDFFGLIIDSKKFKVFLPRDKIDKIKNAAESLLQEDCISIREVAAFIAWTHCTCIQCNFNWTPLLQIFRKGQS